MHSVDYAVARCSSVTCRYSVNTAEHILKIFSPSGSPTILVFPYQTWQYSDRDPQTRASNARGYEKNCDFRPISRFISKMMQDMSHSYYGRRIGNRTQAFKWYQFEWSWVTSKPIFQGHDYSTSNNSKSDNDRKSYVIYRTAPFSLILNDPYSRFKGHAIHWRSISQKRYKKVTRYIVSMEH